MCDNPVILNLHFLNWDSKFLRLCQASFAVEGKSLSEVTHLALARSQNAGTGILGFNFELRRQSLWTAFFIHSVLITDLYGDEKTDKY